MIKQNLNALIMYVYLLYYSNRIRKDRTYMLKEAINELKGGL